MAKLKMLRYPKKPKSSASVATMERYLQKVREVDSENRHRASQNKKAETLRKKIAGIGSVKSSTSRRRKSRR
jgi:hypothetical protein